MNGDESVDETGDSDVCVPSIWWATGRGILVAERVNNVERESLRWSCCRHKQYGRRSAVPAMMLCDFVAAMWQYTASRPCA